MLTHAKRDALRRLPSPKRGLKRTPRSRLRAGEGVADARRIPLLGSDIYERLRRQGVDVTDNALNNELAELTSCGRIPLTLESHGDTPGQARAGGGATVHDVEDDLCE